MNSARIALLAAAAALALPSCDGSRQAVGTATSIIVLTTDSVWAAIGDSVMTALEPRVYTVRSERTFEVTQISPSNPDWQELREFRQVLAIGAPEDAWVEPILARANAQAGGGQPQVVTTRDVWARNQQVTAIAVPAAGADDAALGQVGRVGEVIDSLFRIYVVQRMYTSGPDTALSRALRETHGFAMLLPNVYSPLERTGDVLLFQNNTTVGGDLARSVLVTWRDEVAAPSLEAALTWRDSVGGQLYNPPQHTLRDSVSATRLTIAGGDGIEIQGAWEGTDPAWPMGGFFITRMVTCQQQNRTYLLDTWLYAPGPRRSKYEYMIQLQTILGTFECA
ncbi:MAG: DUF4837 family protein [Gemmatimonadetes bacterium]|nr:DUF4837 family protein [Gemmatimonadota bacterium]